ncbi:MAG: metallophosphoesterase [Actinomycetes bacterium]
MRKRMLSTLRKELTWRHVGLMAGLLVVALFGAWVGLTLGAQRSDVVGPLTVESEVALSWSGDTVIDVPPLGTIELDTHDGPLALHAQVESLDTDVTHGALSGYASRAELERVPDQVRGLLVRAYVQAVIVAVLGAAVAVLLVWRRPKFAVLTAAAAAAVLVLGAAAGAATWNERALAQPRYSGLLVFVPRVVGDAGTIVSNFEEYGQQLGDLVNNVAELSVATQSLPQLGGTENDIRALHVSDIHLNPNVWPILRSVVKQYDIDVILDTGDIADHGTSLENRLLTPIETLGVPYVYVRGNHDSSSTAAAIAAMDNATVLNGSVTEVAGLTIAGTADPRFTPDKTTQSANAAVVDSGADLAEVISRSSEPVDLALVHDPTAADPLAGVVPLVLAGHVHERADRQLDMGTTVLVQGSTGGAGLRALEDEEPTPLMFSVLYFDPTSHELQARDEFTLGGLGAASAEVERVIEDRSTQ